MTIIASFLLWRSGFNLREIQTGFVVEKVALAQAEKLTAIYESIL
jgi:hypothetical protein